MKYQKVSKTRTVEGYTRFNDGTMKLLLDSDTHPATRLCDVDARKCPVSGKVKYGEWCQNPRFLLGAFVGRCRKVKIIRKTTQEVEIKAK
jgi:hypothetical protein